MNGPDETAVARGVVVAAGEEMAAAAGTAQVEDVEGLSEHALLFGQDALTLLVCLRLQ